MQHGEGCRPQSVKRRFTIEIADNRNDAVRAQTSDILGSTHESIHARPAAQQLGRAQRDIATAYQQYPDHRGAVRVVTRDARGA